MDENDLVVLTVEKVCDASLDADNAQPVKFKGDSGKGTRLYDNLRNFPTLSDAPPGLSLRHLSRKLTTSIHSRAISDLWWRRADLDATRKHQWLRNLPGDSPARPESYHGHGEWLHCLPGKWGPHSLIQSSEWVSTSDSDFLPRAQDSNVAEPPRGENDANTFSILMADMLHAAPKDSTPEGMIALETSSLSLPGKPD